MGLGRALAMEYASRGYGLALLGRTMERLQPVLDELQASGAAAIPVLCDVNVASQVNAAVAVVQEKLGRIDVVVACAGIQEVGTFEAVPLEAFCQQFATNVFGVLHLAQASVGALRTSQGHLVLVGSVFSYLTATGYAAYGMSKYAVRALAETLWMEKKTLGFNTTLVCPGTLAMSKRRPAASRLQAIVRRWIAMPPEVAARQIVSGVAKNKREIIVTFHARVFIYLARWTPWAIPLIWRLKDALFRRPNSGGGADGSP